MLPSISLEEGIAIAGLLRSDIVSTAPPTRQTITLSLSMGVTRWNMEQQSLEYALEVANKALYLAKGQGGNRVEVDQL